MALNQQSYKANQLSIFSFGLIVLAASLFTYLVILSQVYGRYSIQEVLPTEENLRKLIASQNKSAAVLYSEYSEGLSANSTWLSENANTWKKFIESTGIECQIIHDQAIETGEHFKYGLIVLPSAKAMSDRQIIQLKRYLENGGSIFATSGTASFNENGKWRGWKFLVEFFGLRFTKELSNKEVIRLQKIKGDLPITAGVPAGYSLKIATWNRPIACKVVESRTKQVSYWSTSSDKQESLGREIEDSAGIVYGTYGKGKFVWMGFEIDSVKGTREGHIFFDRLFKNCIHWVYNIPTIWLKDWPAPYTAAAAITPFLSGNDISNIENILGIVEADSIPITFFVDPLTAEGAKEQIEKLAQYGEISAIADLGSFISEGHQQVLLYDFETQLVNLKKAKATLEEVTKVKIRGAMPFYGSYDENSIHALIEAGFDYIIADSLGDRTIPKTNIKKDGVVVSLARTTRDDFEIVEEFGLEDTTFQLDTYIDDINSIRFLGGTYILKIHPAYQCRSGYAPVVQKIAKYIRDNDIWLTTLSEIKDWWVARNSLEINYGIRSERRIVLQVSNAGNSDLRDFIIQISFNRTVQNVTLSSDVIGTKVPQYEYDNEKQALLIHLDLKSKETLSYFIDFDNINI